MNSFFVSVFFEIVPYKNDKTHLIYYLVFFFNFSADSQTLVNGGPTPTVVKSTPQPAPASFNSKEERGKAFRQVVAAFVANLGTINTGLVFGFSAVVIPQLRQSDSLIPIDDNEASWIGKLKMFRKKYLIVCYIFKF